MLPERGQYLNEQTPMTLLAMAIEKNLDIDKLEKLMLMKERFDKKEAEKKFFIAFARFQSIVPDLKKNRLVSFDNKPIEGKTRTTSYFYQELADIALHIRKPLDDCGLSYRWDQKENAGVIELMCILSHIDGHELRSAPLSGSPDSTGGKNSIQSKGSTITYLRRITLTGILGLSSMDDDDGKGGAKVIKGEAPKPNPNDAQFENMKSRIEAQDTPEKRKEVFEGFQKNFDFKPEQLGGVDW